MKFIFGLKINLCDECIEYIVSMMMEPYDEIVNPLMKQMSSDEEKYFNIPINRTVEDLRTILEKNYSNILKLILQKKKAIKIFGLYQKIKKNQDWLIDLKEMDLN